MRGAAPHLRGQLDQQLMISGFPQPLMELLVEFVHAHQVMPVSRLEHLVHDQLQVGLELRGEPVFQPPDYELLQHDAQARYFLEQPRRQRRDPRTPAGQPLDQALLGEPGQCLAQRNVADPEILREPALHEPVPRFVLTAPDRGADPLHHRVREALIGQQVTGAHLAAYRCTTWPGASVRSTIRCSPSTMPRTGSKCTGSCALGRSSTVAGPTHASCSTTSAKRRATSSRLTKPSSS